MEPNPLDRNLDVYIVQKRPLGLLHRSRELRVKFLIPLCRVAYISASAVNVQSLSVTLFGHIIIFSREESTDVQTIHCRKFRSVINIIKVGNKFHGKSRRSWRMIKVAFFFFAIHSTMKPRHYIIILVYYYYLPGIENHYHNYYNQLLIITCSHYG